jgi:hypothetical protein
MKKLLLIVLLAFPLIVLANAEDEAKIACDLAKAQAEVIAAGLKAPSAFVSLGDPAIEQQSISVGLTQSISDIYEASRIRHAAEAQCESAQSLAKIEQFVVWSRTDIQKRGAAASLKLINDAIDMAAVNVKILNDQLAAKTTTIANLNAAEVQLEALQKTKSSLLSTIAIVIPSTEFGDISELIRAYQRSEGKAAELKAKANAHSGWDISVSAGERKPIGAPYDNESQGTSPFITTYARYSFGTNASMRAAEEVGRDTELLLQNRQLGYNKILERQRKETQDLADIEATNVQVANKELEALRRISIPLESIESALAQDTRRVLDIQIKTIEADLAGAKIRLESFKELLVKMGIAN